MCEAKIDWTKPVELFFGKTYVPVEVLWHDARWPGMTVFTWGSKHTAHLAENYAAYLRNAPPDPPAHTEVWVVWRKQDDKVWYYGTYHEPVRNLPSEDFWQQKVTCEGPVW